MMDWINKHTGLAVGIVLAALALGFWLLSGHKGQSSGPPITDKTGRDHF